ncbi:MAG: S8 family serine peptidase [Chloroflexota bacterium]|nr:S8 family serine peptidase [Chloroflexota bacterium]
MVLLVAAFSTPAPAVAAQSALDGRYIVVLRPGTDAHAAAASLGRAHGLGVTHIYDVVLGGFAATVPNDAALAALRRNPQVAFVEPDQIVYTASSATLPNGVDRVGADGATGAGAAVAVLDTGIAVHPDLAVAGGYNCTNSDTGAYGDGHGHGTHVAGTIGANGGVVGVAPGTPLYAMKVLGDNGSGQWSWVICGINETARRGITVANLSLVGASSESPDSCANSSLHQAICDAVAQGVRFAVAAGNNGADASGYVPAKYPEVTAVSALADSDGCTGGAGPATSSGADDTRASFSNYGSVVDVAAPGVDIYSTVPGGYGTKSGTSMAAPHVAALFALGGYVKEDSVELPEGIANVASGDIACGGSTGTNQAPAATDDSATTTADTAVTIDVLANDTDPDGDALTVTNLTIPASGQATLNADNTMTYAPNAGFSGTDSFTYTANDGAADSNVATVTVTVSAVEQVPAAPASLTATVTGVQKGNATISLAWPDTANETGYRVYRSTNGGAYQLILDNLPADTTSAKDQVKRNRTYQYAVAAFNAAGESAWITSSAVSVSGAEAEAVEATDTDANGLVDEQVAPLGSKDASAAGTIVVTVDAVNLRAAPSRQATVVVELAAGTPLTVTAATVLAEGLAWVPVVTADGLLTGYVAADFLAPA